MKTVKLRFCNEAAKTQDLSIPAVQATALVFGAVYEVSEALAQTLMQQGGWQPVPPPAGKAKQQEVAADEEGEE